MRDESCRKCGNGLQVTLTCSFCEKPIKLHCNNCNIDTEERIHFECYKNSFENELKKIQAEIRRN